MDRSVARLNMEHFKKLLETEADEKKRQILAQLLSEEEAKLEKANQETKDRRQG
jgi:hypothetical protein